MRSAFVKESQLQKCSSFSGKNGTFSAHAESFGVNLHLTESVYENIQRFILAFWKKLLD